jgi:pilus assembly protein CpaF
MLSAMTTGHDGSLTTVHANSPEGALDRVQTLALMAGVEIPHEAVARMAASAIDLVVHQRRAAAGTREVAAIAEVVRDRGSAAVRPLMQLSPDGSEAWTTATSERVATLLEAGH